MKKFLSFTALVLALLMLASCSGKKQNPAPVKGTEVTTEPAEVAVELTPEEVFEMFMNCYASGDDAELLASLMVDPAIKEYYFAEGYYDSEEAFVAEFQAVIDEREEYIAELEAENNAEYTFEYNMFAITEYSEDDLAALEAYIANDAFYSEVYAPGDIEAFITVEAEVTERCGD